MYQLLEEHVLLASWHSFGRFIQNVDASLCSDAQPKVILLTSFHPDSLFAASPSPPALAWDRFEGLVVVFLNPTRMAEFVCARFYISGKLSCFRETTAPCMHQQ